MEELLNNFSSFIDLASRTTHSTNRNPDFRFPTSNFLVENFDFPAIDFYITESVIQKILNFHGVSIDFLKTIPSILNNENAALISRIFKSHTREDSSVIVSFEFVGQKPIVIAIHKNKQINTNDYVNSIASIYEKDDAEAKFKIWEEKGLLLYKNPTQPLIFPDKKPIIRVKRKVRTEQLEQKD